MAWEPLILKGYLKMGLGDGLTGGSAGMTDVSDQVTEFQLLFERDTIEIPATLGQPRQARVGGAKYSIRVGYLSANNGTGVWSILESAFASSQGYVSFEGAMTDDAISATNARYFGTLLATGAALGGTAEDVVQDSQTFPLKSTWTKATT